ncbi:MAG: hypothetical protein J2O49_06710, partial [Sciscionella sp.]|nr:hypothetical protein [Sciscionella sp.]
ASVVSHPAVPVTSTGPRPTRVSTTADQLASTGKLADTGVTPGPALLASAALVGTGGALVAGSKRPGIDVDSDTDVEVDAAVALDAFVETDTDESESEHG